jgi:hypothetical protein
MSEQREFLKGVRERLNGVQTRASSRLETLNHDAKKVFDDLAEKGRESQKDLTSRLQKILPEDLGKKVREVRGRAVSYVDSASRERAAAVAENLRRVASRLDHVARRATATPAEVH